jgi:hypothetical protein
MERLVGWLTRRPRFVLAKGYDVRHRPALAPIGELFARARLIRALCVSTHHPLNNRTYKSLKIMAPSTTRFGLRRGPGCLQLSGSVIHLASELDWLNEGEKG